MEKRLYFITTIMLSAAALSLSSCLKDDGRYTNFAGVGTIVQFPLGGQSYFGADAITASGDTIVQQFAVNVASPSVPTTASSITFSVNDPSIIASVNASQNAVTYLPMPVNAFAFTQTTVTIPAGQRTAILTVTFYKNNLDPSKSYMLPIAIKNAGGLNISGNQGIMYYHFIGNVFAGAYRQTFRRWNATDSTTAGTLSGVSFANQPTIITPVSPTEFQMYTGYDGGAALRYDVTFTINGGGMYGNFAVTFVASDIANNLTPNGVTITNGPVFLSTGTPSLPGSYTVAQAQALFAFQFGAHSSASRYCVDYFYK
ncbi:MAG TPA: DUF1735 domain-containing protein [Mucilaginibacter sp.]|jgi:hypothetical protein|nr:DUF1735 domain-containing protein [Mucilaginibacter sp.]